MPEKAVLMPPPYSRKRNSQVILFVLLLNILKCTSDMSNSIGTAIAIAFFGTIAIDIAIARHFCISNCARRVQKRPVRSKTV